MTTAPLALDVRTYGIGTFPALGSIKVIEWHISWLRHGIRVTHTLMAVKYSHLLLGGRNLPYSLQILVYAIINVADITFRFAHITGLHICTLNELYVIADPIFFGFLHHQEAHIGVNLLAGNFHSDHERHVNVNHIEIEPHGMSNQSGKNANGSEATLEDFSHSQFFRTGFYKGSACHDLIVSMKYLEKLTKKLYEFEYYMEKQQIAYIKEENEKLVEVYPESPNAYELRCSIYSSLKFSPLDKVAFFMYH
eukprot:Gb_18213 [translate_table: standard]